MEELHDKIRDLEKHNHQYKEKVLITLTPLVTLNAYSLSLYLCITVSCFDAIFDWYWSVL